MKFQNPENMQVQPAWVPTFLEGDAETIKKELEKSPYYWWFEYLKLNQTYREYFDWHDLGDEMSGIAYVAEHFGNVYDISFQEWWEANGQRLFGVLNLTSEIQIIDLLDAHQALTNTESYLLLKVPLTFGTKRELKRQFGSILKQHHHRNKLINRVGMIYGNFYIKGLPNVSALKSHYKVYVDRINNPDKPYWKIAQDNIEVKKELRAKNPDLYARNTLSSFVTRHMKCAKALIHNVGLGNFPDFTAPKSGFVL